MNNLDFVCKIELTDDDVAKVIMQHYAGRTFPVMLTYYDNGKYSFEGYAPKTTMVDITPKPLEIDVVA